MGIKFKLLFGLLTIVIVGVSIIFGGSLAFKDQMPIYDGLKSTASIIFGVMGAWIAIVYPTKLADIFGDKPFNEKKKAIEDIKVLFKPMIYSTVILIIVIAMSFLVPLAKQITCLQQYKEVFRALSFGGIALLSLLQLWSLVLTLIPAASLKEEVDYVHERGKTVERMKPTRKSNKR